MLKYGAGCNRRQLLKGGTAALGGLLVGKTVCAQTLDSEHSEAITLLDFCSLKDDERWVDSPVLAANGRGRAWAVSVEYLPDDTERMICHEFNNVWSNSEIVVSERGRYSDPAIACVEGGYPILTWVRNDGDQWFPEILIHDGKKFSHPVRLSGIGRAAVPRVTVEPDGRFAIAWESYRDGRFGIEMVVGTDFSELGAVEQFVAEDNLYDPSVVFADDGLLYLAFSKAEMGHRNIYMRCFSIDRDNNFHPVRFGNGQTDFAVCLGGEIVKGALPITNNYPSLGLDRFGDVWIGYESRKAKLPCAAYFGERVGSAVRYKNGRLEKVSNSAEGYAGLEVLRENDHFPELMRDGYGQLWMFSCSFQSDRSWQLRGSYLIEGKGWSKPISLLKSYRFGRKNRPAVAAVDKDSILLVWQSDNWLDVDVEKTAGRLCSARIAIPKFPRTSLKMSTVPPGKPCAVKVGRSKGARRRITRNGEEFTLLYGNLHEHSDLSRCWPDGSDGTLDDNYRYGMDVEGYDFVGMTDHGFDLYEAAWRHSRRRAEFYNDNPHFIAIPAYEWTLSAAIMGKTGTCPDGSGHRNVIFASAKDAERLIEGRRAVFSCFSPETDRIDKLWAVLRSRGIRAVTIPHHPVDKQHPVSWKYTDPEYEPVLEMYQCRGSCEYPGCPGEGPAQNLYGDPECYADAVLRKGRRIGFIASGDHNSMGQGLAALYVREISRIGIIEALKARRCFGTMGDRIYIDFRVNGHLMGEDFLLEETPRLTAQVETPFPLKEVSVFKNDKVFKEFSGTEIQNPFRFDFEVLDNQFSENARYYTRVIQKNGQIAWTSPIWVGGA